MIQTAVISLTLIGVMFLFTECGNKETQDATKVEVDKDGSPKYLIQKSKDISYSERDKEIALASYISVDEEEVKSMSSINDDVNNKESAMKVVTISKAKVIEANKTEVVESVVSIEVNSTTPKAEVVEVNQIEVPKPVVPIEANSSIPKAEVVEVNKIEVPKPIAPIEINSTTSKVEVVEVNTTEVVEPVASIEENSTVSKAEVIEVNTTEVVEPVVLIEENSTVSKAEVEEVNKTEVVEPVAPIEENSTVSKAEVIEVNTTKVIEPVASIEENSTVSKSEVVEVNTTKVVEPVAPIEENSTTVSKAEVVEKNKVEVPKPITPIEVNRSLPIVSKSVELVQAVEVVKPTTVEGIVKKITLPTVPLIPEVKIVVPTAPKSKSMEVVASNSKIVDELHLERETKDEALEKNIILENQLEKGRMQEFAQVPAHSKNLPEKNSEVLSKITNLLAIVQEKTAKAEADYNATQVKVQKLLADKERLESNLIAKFEKEKHLTATNSELSAKILELLAIAKEGTQKAEAEYNATQAKVQNLLVDKKNLEANLTVNQENEKRLTATNSELSAKILELLSIAKEGTAKAEAEYNATQAKVEKLLSNKESLESNLTASQEHEKRLSTTITNLLTIAKEGTAKAEAEYNATQAKVEKLLTDKESLEENLTASQEYEKALKSKNDELSEKITNLLIIAKEGTAKAEAEYNATQAKVEKLLSNKESLESNLTASQEHEQRLSTTITNLLTIAKEGTAKAEAEYNATQAKVEKLLTDKESLEENLTASQEHEKALKSKNNELSAKITNLLIIAKEGTAKAEAEYNATQAKVEKLLFDKANLEENLTASQEYEKALKSKNDELSEKITNLLIIAKEGTAKAEAEYNATQAKVEKLLADKESLEENLTVKQEHEKHLRAINSELSAKIVELLSIAKEGTAKAEAEYNATQAKAQEQLNFIKEEKEKATTELKRLLEEKAEAERLAKEKTQKVAEEKLLKAFSLTQVEFKFNSIELTDESKKRLNETAKVMNEYHDFNYIIQGHTDSSGKEEYNVELSTERANKVKEYLVSQGVDAALLSTKGFGSASPIATNETKEGRFQNRRVVFEIVK